MSLLYEARYLPVCADTETGTNFYVPNAYLIFQFLLSYDKIVMHFNMLDSGMLLKLQLFYYIAANKVTDNNDQTSFKIFIYLKRPLKTLNFLSRRNVLFFFCEQWIRPKRRDQRSVSFLFWFYFAHFRCHTMLLKTNAWLKFMLLQSGHSSGRYSDANLDQC